MTADADRDRRFYDIWIAKAIKDTMYWIRLANYSPAAIRAIGQLFFDLADGRVRRGGG